VSSRKLATEEHGGPLARDYIAYAVQDTQVTWECYAELSKRYAKHGLAQTPMHRIKNRLKIYSDALADYHLHPEAKFFNGDYLDRGPTERRHVHVAGVRYIGKEANRWEEQFYLGLDPEAQIEYGCGPEAIEQLRARISEAAAEFGQRKLARASGVSREQLRAIINGGAAPRKVTVARLMRTITTLIAAAHCTRAKTG
jgi:DNA-binding phage protein